jgi:LysR family transcriptional activator of nhaA
MKLFLEGKAVWVNFHHLHCFWVVATEGGLTQASARLGIGQSALSIQMRQFEESLGFSLFRRSHRKLTLTEQGRVVLSYAKEIFRLGEEMVETLHDRPSEHRVQLKIGVLDTIPKHLTIQLVQHALDSKDCGVSVVEGRPEALLEDLSSHRIDLVLMNFMPKISKGRLRAKKIAELPLWVVGRRMHLPLKQGFPRSLDREPFVVPTEDSHVRHEFQSFCVEHELNPELLVEAQDVMVQKLLVLEGVGLGVVPEAAVREYLDDGTLFLIGKLGLFQEELYLVAAERKIENPVAARLWKEFKPR